MRWKEICPVKDLLIEHGHKAIKETYKKDECERTDLKKNRKEKTNPQ